MITRRHIENELFKVARLIIRQAREEGYSASQREISVKLYFSFLETACARHIQDTYEVEASHDQP